MGIGTAALTAVPAPPPPVAETRAQMVVVKAGSQDDRSARRHARVVGGRIFAQEKIARAVDLGLGVDQPELINLVTDGQVGRAFVERVRPVLLQG